MQQDMKETGTALTAVFHVIEAHPEVMLEYGDRIQKFCVWASAQADEQGDTSAKEVLEHCLTKFGF